MSQINFLTNKFPLQEFNRARWQEIVERRNVFTHRSGRVDEDYVNVHKLCFKTAQTVTVGERLRIGKSYIKESIEYLHLWGLVLCQKIWEKSESAEQKAGQGVSNTIMQLIRDGRHDFGAEFCKGLLSNLQFKSRHDKEILIINNAICVDKQGKVRTKERLLNKIRESPRHSIPPMLKGAKNKVIDDGMSARILMAKSALLGDNKRALDYMEQAANEDEITFLDLDYWVIFDYLRNEPRFQEIQAKMEAKIK